jgi:glyoxylase-like metal-dependent hydrolase (beta-lactamase superfamily II)
VATFAGLAVAALAVLLVSFRAAPLPAPPPFAGPLPAARPPAGMEVVQLPTGITYRTAAVAYRGGSFFDRRDFVMTAVLVRHPRGDVLIDTGLGKNIDAQVTTMPRLFQWVAAYHRQRSAAEQMQAAGYDRRQLHAVLLTHAHWDHVSGLDELGETPVWVTAPEHRFIANGGALSAVARSLRDVRYQEYDFSGGEYLGFPRSRDLYGDGSIVIVPAPGHTPGSVIVFLNLPDGRRYALVGDLCWQREGILHREERPWLLRSLADGDAGGVRENLVRMAALAARFPNLVLAPSHDSRGFAGMARLTP